MRSCINRGPTALVGLLMLAGGLSACQTMSTKETGGAVASRSPHKDMTLDEYREVFLLLKPEQRGKLANSRDALLDFVLDLHSNADLAVQAREQGLLDDPETRARLHGAYRKVLSDALISKTANAVQPPEDLEALAHERYLQQREQWLTQERRRVAHILVRDWSQCPCEAPDMADTVAKIQKRLADGADFAELAKAYSDDKTSAERGGELPNWIMRDAKTVPQFENAVFALKNVGDVSEPVQSAYGLHLIKLLEIEPARQLGFDEVRSVIEKQINDQRVFSAMEQLRGSAYPKNESIDFDGLRALLEELGTATPPDIAEMIAKQGGEPRGDAPEPARPQPEAP